MRLLAVTALSFILVAISARAEELEYCHKGLRAVSAGNHDLALDYFTRCIDEGGLTATNLAQAYNNRGVTYLERGEYDRAIRDLDEVIRLDPSDYGAYNSRCWAYGSMRRANEALRDCNVSLRLHPDAPATLDSRALAYWLLGDQDKARQDLERAHQIAPAFPAWQNRFREFEEMFEGCSADWLGCGSFWLVVSLGAATLILPQVSLGSGSDQDRPSAPGQLSRVKPTISAGKRTSSHHGLLSGPTAVATQRVPEKSALANSGNSRSGVPLSVDPAIGTLRWQRIGTGKSIRE